MGPQSSNIAERTKLASEADCISALEAHIDAVDFPCVGAKSARARNNLSIMAARDINSAWDDLRIHRALLEWSWAYDRSDDELQSFAVVFQATTILEEEAFEKAMWERLQSLADKDNWLGQSYAKDVVPEPDSPHFGLSFGGEAYFVVGMHPGASRPARRFRYSAMVFNLHNQFVRLRENGRYERMRAAILERDKALAGSINPMLARHGEASEARQYSGRKVSGDWKCPFQDKRAKS